jgi:hypothetical protein
MRRIIVFLALATYLAPSVALAAEYSWDGAPLFGAPASPPRPAGSSLLESPGDPLSLPPVLLSSTIEDGASAGDDSTGGRMRGRKSPVKAAALSLLLPGMGELYGGAPGRARVFLIAEASVWATYTVFLMQGRMLRDDYRLFAIAQAGASTGRTDEEYLRALEEFRTLEEYNQDVRREARKLFPGDEAGYEEYIRENLISASDEWEWTDPATWDEYRLLRGRSRDAFHRAAYCTAAAVANRIISAVDALMTVRFYNRDAERQAVLRLEVEPTIAEPGIRVGLCYTH